MKNCLPRFHKTDTNLFYIFLSFVIFGTVIICFPKNIYSSGVGVSPPYIENDRLLRGSHYEAEFVISRSNPKSEEKAIIKIDAPVKGMPASIEEWISFEDGKTIKLPKGQESATINTIIDVPEDATLGHYSGYIRVYLERELENEQVQVTPAVRLDIDLTVVDEVYRDLEVMQVEIDKTAQGGPLVLNVKAINNGSAKSRLSNADIDLRDLNLGLLKTIQSERVEGDVEAFSKGGLKVIFADPGLEVGKYYGDVSVDLDGDTIFTKRLVFEIVYGDIQKTFDIWPDLDGDIGRGKVLMYLGYMILIVGFSSAAIYVLISSESVMAVSLRKRFRNLANIYKRKKS